MDNGGAFTDRLFAQASIPDGATALDIGCGGGDVAFRLSKAVGARGHVTGLDLNDKALDRARAKATEMRLENIEFLNHDFLSFAQDGQTFDVVTCRRVLMYLPDQRAATKALFSLLNPGGI